ncbi:MAG: putative ABC transport system substrate-binding protein [bacterium P3]|nr:MAG: putative ABC transport system substrate-binding protein [bacterium P3]KWW33251.1 MAG: putative ABC transport system substrate-binding protein [bacterium F083]
MKNKYFLILIIVTVLAGLYYTVSRKNSKKDLTICAIQYIEHPNLEKMYRAFQEEINKWAEENNKTVIFELQIANQDVSLASQIANRYVQSDADMILALGTPAAQAAQRATKKTPIVFGAITDPVEIGLVESLEHPGKNVTGSSDKWPYEKQFEMIKSLLPETEDIGIVYNPSEANSENAMRDIRRIAGKMGFHLYEVPVSSSTEVYTAAQSLVRKSDIFFAPADNTVLSALDAYLKVAKQYHIPLFVGDEGSVEKGGIATYGPDYYDLGIETGKLAVRILNGESPSELAVVRPTTGTLVVNKKSSEYFNIEYPDSLLKQAKIFE